MFFLKWRKFLEPYYTPAPCIFSLEVNTLFFIGFFDKCLKWQQENLEKVQQAFFGLVMFLERIIKWSEYAKITDEKIQVFEEI